MLKKPKISVIIPVYNVEPYLSQCIDSVLEQSFTDFELIIIDDGSSDNCGTICEEYAARDNRIQVIHQENAGSGKARNVGMDLAVGKYIIFLDSDDYWVPSTLDILYSEAERNQTQVLVFGGKLFWDKLKVPKNANPDWLSLHAQNDVVKTGPESLKISLDKHEYFFVAWNRFYLTSYLRENGLCFDEGVIYQDVTFAFPSYLFAERVECIGERLYLHRKHPGSETTGQSIQSRVRGYRVALDNLLEVWISHLRSEQEDLLIERYCTMRIGMVIQQYEIARRHKDWKSARFIQKEIGPTLKRARALPNLPRSMRNATYSLFWNWFVHKIKTQIHTIR